MKSVQIRRFFWSVFPVFGLNTEIYGASYQIFKKERLDRISVLRSQNLRGWLLGKRGWLFQKGLLIKKMFLSVITKNLNWAILTKNLVCKFKDGGGGDLTKKRGWSF